MKHTIFFLIICTSIINLGYSQSTKTELQKFIQKELKSGDYIFYLMKVNSTPRNAERKIIVDDNGKILNPQLDLIANEEVPDTKLYASGSLKLSLRYTDSILSIEPLENSFCPSIKVNLVTTTAQINDAELSSINKISISSKNNGFGSAWSGFRWQTESETKTLSFNSRLTIGKLIENDKLYLEIMWIEKGIKMHYRLLT
jgi:hypothetical protein